MVNISLRVLTKPDVDTLSTIFKVCRLLHKTARTGASDCQDTLCVSTGFVCEQNLGLDWDERVLPSIGNEIIKAVVAQYNAEQLLTQRDKVSKSVRPCFSPACWQKSSLACKAFGK